MAFENDETKAERELEVLERQHAATQAPDPAAVKPEPEGQTEKPAGEVEKPAETAPAKTEDDGYKQRYQTLQGIMRSERAKWDAERAELIAQIQKLQARPPQNDSVEVEEDYRSSLVSDEVRQSLAYRRMAELNGQRHAEIHFESMAAMQPKEQPKEKAKGPSQDFFSNLSQLAPKWQVLNQDPKFLSFLAQTAPYSGGMTLQTKLDQAVQAGDAASAAQFFLDFEDNNREAPPARQVPEELVTPPRRSSAAQTAADTHKGKVYTTAEWNAGWKKLELDNMPAKAAAELELDLTNAPSEGRVVG